MHGNHVATYMASYVVDCLIGTGQKSNKNGDIHDVTASNDKVVEVRTCETNNPA